MKMLGLRCAIACALVTMCATLVGAQGPDFSKVEIKAQKVAEGIYMLTGAGGNIGVSVGEDGIVIVDDQYAPLAPKIQAALKGISDKPVRFVLNTHYHGDHTGGNADFGKTGSTIIAHENVRKRLTEGYTIARFGMNEPPASKEALPVITFDQSATVHLNGEDIRALHFPNGHTDGDSVIFFPKANVVHMGDDFVTYGFPFVDVEHGGSVSGMIAGDEKILSMVPADAKFIPGHGALRTADDVRKFISMMKETRAIVADAVRKKMTVEKMKANKILAKYEEQYGKGFIKTDDWIDTLFADITQKKTGAHYHNHGHAGEVSGGK
jgi:cyclase